LEYATRIKNVFEGDRVHNQKNLYQFNALSLHPSEGDKFTDAQMIEMAKEVYLKNGVKNGLNDNRHYLFVVERNTKHHHVHAMIHLTDLETKKVNNKMIDYNPIIKKLELKYGLYNEHRKPKDESEYKKTFKKELKDILDNASLTKDEQTFKASDLAVSYKTLKAALGDDQEFAATLALLHKEKPGNDGFGTIGVDFHDLQSAITERNIKNQKSNRVLDTRFETDDGHLYRFKDSNRKAFSYSNGTARFNSISPIVIKAGLQKLTESGKSDTLHLSGDDAFKRVAWLQFHMMNLDEKGYSLKGYEPTQSDRSQLEKMKLENTAFLKSAVEKTSDMTSSFSESTMKEIAKLEQSPQLEDPAFLSGVVEKMADMSESISAGTMEEKLSEMRVIDQEIKDSKNQAEEVHYKNKRRKLQQPRPN
jgi:hypothetical protein